MKLKLTVPLLIVLLAIVSEYSGLDVALSRPFFDPATNTWPLKSNFITAGVLHNGAKDVVVYVMLGVLLLLVLSFFVKRLRPFRKGSAYMLFGSLLGPAVVGVLKSTTRIYTPWDLAMFGGDKPHVRIFDAAPAGLPVGNAFPGGHSSGGFAFLSLYFLLSVYCPRYRYYGLAFGLLLGSVFAATQEVRGAHFLSHDLFSMVICWYCALAVHWLMFRKELSGMALTDTKTADAPQQ